MSSTEKGKNNYDKRGGAFFGYAWRKRAKERRERVEGERVRGRRYRSLLDHSETWANYPFHSSMCAMEESMVHGQLKKNVKIKA